MPRCASGIWKVVLGGGLAVIAVGSATAAGMDDASRGRCVEVLRAGLKSAEFWPAMHAAEGMSAAGLGGEVRDFLAPRLPTEFDAQHRCGIARELARAGDRSAIRVLLDVLAAPDPYGHAHAAESLYKFAEVGDGASLRKAMTSADPSLASLMAAAALARWGNPTAFARVRSALQSEDETLSRTAAWILARIGEPSDVPALRLAAERWRDPLTTAYFDHALAALGDPAGAKALVRNLSHAEPKIRTQAAEFAAVARPEGVGHVLLRLLDDPALDVRIRAAHALVEMESPRRASGDEFAVDVFPADEEHPRYSEGSVVVLKDGRLLYATTEFDVSSSDFARARIVAVESADEGRTWGSRRVLQENVGGMNVMSTSLFRVAPGAFDGPIGFLFLRKDSETDLHAFLRTSEDEGASFGPMVEATPGEGYHVVNNDRVTVLSTGRLVVPAASTGDVGKGGRFEASCFLSDDRGKTWRRSRTILPYPKRGAMEPEVLELDGGKLLMHFRTQLGHVAASTSDDGGETWSGPRSWDVGAPEAPATLRRIPATGDLLLIWNDSVRPGEDHGGRRAPLSVAVSADEGRSWSRPIEIEPDAGETYAYTSVAFHRGRALLSYYVGPASGQRLSSRFRSIPVARFYPKVRGDE